jgi:hypothetical protein
MAPYSQFNKLIAALEVTTNGGISIYPVAPNENRAPAMPPAFEMRPEYLKAQI